MSEQQFSAELNSDDSRHLELWTAVINDLSGNGRTVEALDVFDRLITTMRQRGMGEVNVDDLKAERARIAGDAMSIPDLSAYLRREGLIP